jgi:4-aminobutyrate aminotransferase-like enzyme/Ser/Thr protein kinase RdoA (MazF antagonist)
MSQHTHPRTDDVLESPAPALTENEAEGIALDVFGICGRARPLDSERDQNFHLSAEDGKQFVLKIANPAESASVIDLQARTLAWIARTDPDLPVPHIHPTQDGQPSGIIAVDSRSCIVRAVTYLDGLPLGEISGSAPLRRALGTSLAHLDRALQGFFHPGAGHELLWDLKYAGRLKQHLDTVQDINRRSLARAILERFTDDFRPVLAGFRAQVIHNDLNPGNVLVDPENHDRIAGIIDFGDIVHAPLINEVAVAAAYQVLSQADPIASACDLVVGYHSVNPLQDSELEWLPLLIMTRLAISVVISSWRAQQHPENIDYITGDQEESWTALEKLNALDPMVMAQAFANACDVPLTGTTSTSQHQIEAGTETLSRQRLHYLGKSLRLSYDEPLHIVRGDGVWLFDADGRRYLDAYNNVAHVGHCHPTVVSAIARQARRLNTNTRYLHGDIVTLAKTITDSMPGELTVCMFVCTGSEANDLAWRIARAVTSGSGAIVTDNAYHGNTTTVTELSPEELTDREPEPWVTTIPAPDTFTGPFQDDPDGLVATAPSQIHEAIQRLADRGHRLAAFMYDTVFTSDGIRLPPEGYVRAIVDAVRKGGGLCIADEVQAGFGRTGEFMWGFQRHGVIPDIVTLGKPMGNGHPIAAVVTTPDIANSFARDQYYFNTFGGNPVSAAAGLAVLDVMARQQLRDNAVDVGDYLRSQLAAMATHHEIIGDIRGAGLFTGVELVSERGGRQAASEAAHETINQMRRNGILIRLTGPHNNVLKIRPPLVFSRANADLLCESLDDVLTAL